MFGMWLKLILLVVAYSGVTQSHSSGGPISRCSSMLPSHSNQAPQTTFPIYQVSAPLFVLQGEVLKVTMEGNDPSVFFKGFMIQARITGSGTVVGRFIPSDEVRTVACPDYPEGAVATHTSNIDKTSITFQWVAPRDVTGIINFHSTIVQERVVFWTEVNSNIVVVLPNENLPEEIVTPPIAPPVEPTTPPEQISVYDGCATEKICFGTPAGCLQSRNCDVFGAVIFDNGKFVFELLSGTAVSYIAMALSDDERMGRDSVIECVNQAGTVKAYASFTTTSTVPNPGSPRIDNQNIIKLLSYSIFSGRIFCRVERDDFTIIDGMVFDLYNEKHHILLASGTALNTDSIGEHSLSAASSEAVLLTVPRNLSVNVRVLLLVHGSLMIVAWIGLASIGIFIARYYKKTWVNQKMCKHDIWFIWHIICMILTWVFTISAYVIIFVEIGQWRTSVHAVTGTIVTILVFFQPIGAIFRPKPSHPSRPIFNFLHFSSGNVMYALALITILYAVPLTSSGLPAWTAYIIVAFAVFYLTMHVLLTTIAIFSEIKSKERLSNNKEAPFSLLNKTLLGFFALTVLFFVIALILVLVFQPS